MSRETTFSYDKDGKVQQVTRTNNGYNCTKEEFLGEVKEFMTNFKGLKATMFTLAIAVLVQVGTFLYLWGGLVTTVSKNTEHLWKEVDPIVKDNSRNIDKILAKLDIIRIEMK